MNVDRDVATFEPVIGGRRVRTHTRVPSEGVCVRVLAPPMPRVALGGVVLKTYHFTPDKPVHDLPTNPAEYDITGLQVIDRGERTSGFTGYLERILTVQGNPNAVGIYERRYIEVTREAIMLCD